MKIKFQVKQIKNIKNFFLIKMMSFLFYIIFCDKSKKIFLNEEYDDFIIFSCLLKLLQIDQSINNYIYKNIYVDH